jgi:hypothetical protein
LGQESGVRSQESGVRSQESGVRRQEFFAYQLLEALSVGIPFNTGFLILSLHYQYH